MKKSITRRIFLIFVVFIISLFTLAGVLLSTILPGYYERRILDDIQKDVTYIKENYDKLDDVKLITLFDELRQKNGGDSYILDATGRLNSSLGMKGNGMGMGKNRINTSQYDFTSDIYEDRYMNKIGVEIYSFGVALKDGFLLYEVSIDSLDDAVGIMLEFLVYLLIASLIIGVLSAYLISNYISKPIRELNDLAKRMKDKEVYTIMTSNKEDELGQLEQSLYNMYEELLSNIQRLETELHKERSLDKMKKQFLAQATHELKTPISVIQGYAELVFDGIYKTEEERDHYIESIYNETESISKLITDVLDYSKMENGFFDINKQDVNIKPWSEKLVQTYDEYVRMKNLDFIYHGVTEDFVVYMDPNRMEQVVKNLLVNAIEHGKSKVKLSVFHLENKLLIEVENDGPPIDEEDLPFIFDSFYKKKGKIKGTGLGLAIVKQIVLLHDGDYRVKNLDKGVKFIIKL